MDRPTPKQLEEARKGRFSSATIAQILATAPASQTPALKAAIAAGLTVSSVQKVETEGITKQMPLEQLYAYSQLYGLDYPSLVQQSRLGG